MKYEVVVREWGKNGSVPKDNVFFSWGIFDSKIEAWEARSAALFDLRNNLFDSKIVEVD
jgi:hypothetical protein